MQRNPCFCLSHVVLVRFLLCAPSALALLVGTRRGWESSAILLTLLLVTAVYTHMTSQWVPRRPYYTWMDYYILLGFLLQLSVVCESWAMAEVYYQRPRDFDKRVDGSCNATAASYVYWPPSDDECSDVMRGEDRRFQHCIFGAWCLFHAALVLGHTRMLKS